MQRKLLKKTWLWRFSIVSAIFLMMGLLTVTQSSFAIETFVASNGLVVSGHQLGAAAALKILQKGGNAVDAMIANYAVKSVTKADMVGPFGGGWALIYIAKTGEIVALDMDSPAPAAASAEKVRKAFREAGWTGPRIPAGPMCRGPFSVPVGGNLKGWEAMLDRYGTMTFAEVLEPAIEYAEKGFCVDTSTAGIIKRYIPELSIYPTWMETFTIEGKAPKPGQRVYNKNLATTFKKVAALGADVVYKGEIADEIARYFKEIGGWITKEDLANYNVVWSKPYKTTYTSSDGVEYTLYGNTAPSSSIEVLETLKILDGYDLKAMGHNSVEYLHAVIEASKLAHMDNYRYVGDPAFVDVPVDKLLSEKYAKKLRTKIDPKKAIEIKAWSIYPTGEKKSSAMQSLQHKASLALPEVHGTTPSIIVDQYGNVVSMTNTHGTFYGGGFVIGSTGMLGSNGIDWMDIEKSPWTNEKSATAVEPGKRNRWTLAPVIVSKNGKPFIAIASAGAETTAQGIVQPILNVIEFGMDMQKAIDAPRFRWGDVLHYTGGTDLWLEVSWNHVQISDAVRKGLAAKGHKIVPVKNAGLNPLVGNTNSILIDMETGARMAGVDSRPGTRDWAMGY